MLRLTNKLVQTYLILIVSIILFTACTTVEEQQPNTVFLVVDDREQTFEIIGPTTVGQFLRDPDVGLELGPLDRPSHSEFTQISDQMRITIVRVSEENECRDVEIPFERQNVPNEGLSPGQEQLVQAGKNGIQEICYRIRIEDGVRLEPVETSRIVKEESLPEVIYVGPSGEVDPVPILGTLAYISNRNAWIIRGSSTEKRPITFTGDLDPRVFSLSEDGRNLLFARTTTTSGFGNQLWMVLDTSRESNPIQLIPGDVLYAAWVPGQEYTISYSTGESRQTPPGWKALNDLWIIRVDPQTGESLNPREILASSLGGLDGWWGTKYYWSNKGDQLAWVRADSLGLVNLDDEELNPPLLTYREFRTAADWSWRATVSWSPEDDLILTTVHGAPLGSEAPETSAAFDIAVTTPQGEFSATVVERAGIWTSPKFSPLVTDPESQFPRGYMAYLRARDIGNSINSQAEYDLIVADRDGSNARIIYPFQGQPGLNAQDFAWSPDGKQIAFIYRGNLWVIDVESEVAHQLTLDGRASQPIWTR